MQTILHPLVADPGCRVRVLRRPDQSGLHAAIDIPAGAIVLFVDGDIVREPTRYTVQVGVGEHVDVGDDDDAGSGGGDGRTPDRFVWRYLNHSCAANAVLHGRLLVAARTIRAGEEVTFDYDTNEWQMAEPFDCRCGQPGCRGRIRGYRHLTPEQRRAVAALVSTHLLTP